MVSKFSRFNLRSIKWIWPLENLSKFFLKLRIFTIVHYTEYFILRDCSGFLQIRSQIMKDFLCTC